MNNDDGTPPQQGNGDSINLNNYVGLLPYLGLAAYSKYNIHLKGLTTQKIKILFVKPTFLSIKKPVTSMENETGCQSTVNCCKVRFSLHVVKVLSLSLKKRI